MPLADQVVPPSDVERGKLAVPQRLLFVATTLSTVPGLSVVVAVMVMVESAGVGDVVSAGGGVNLMGDREFTVKTTVLPETATVPPVPAASPFPVMVGVKAPPPVIADAEINV